MDELLPIAEVYGENHFTFSGLIDSFNDFMPCHIRMISRPLLRNSSAIPE
jgi:hypothetical protein